MKLTVLVSNLFTTPVSIPPQRGGRAGGRAAAAAAAGRVAAEDRVADTVEDLKEELSTIHPGIGDKITLARFDKFIQLTSSCL